MTFKITYLNNGFVQFKKLTRCKQKDRFFLFNSVFYDALENGGDGVVDLGYGVHPFKIEQVD